MRPRAAVSVSGCTWGGFWLASVWCKIPIASGLSIQRNARPTGSPPNGPGVFVCLDGVRRVVVGIVGFGGGRCTGRLQHRQERVGGAGDIDVVTRDDANR